MLVLRLVLMFAFSYLLTPAFAQTPPRIASYTPKSGISGTDITITGTNFGTAQGSSTVSLVSKSNGWTHLTAKSWSNTQIVATVPGGLPSGPQYLYVRVAGQRSLGAHAFALGAAPTITNYSPAFGPAGSTITITGAGFGVAQGASAVTLLSESNLPTNLTVISWGNTQITASLPADISPGLHYLYVTVAGLRNTSLRAFFVGASPTN